MHACEREGKHAQQHSTAQEGCIAGAHLSKFDQLQQLLALDMSTLSLNRACTECSPERDGENLTSPAARRRAPRRQSKKFWSSP